MNLRFCLSCLFVAFFIFGCKWSSTQKSARTPFISFYFKDTGYTFYEDVVCQPEPGGFRISGANKKVGTTFQLWLYSDSLFTNESKFYAVLAEFHHKYERDKIWSNAYIDSMHTKIAFTDNKIISGNFNGAISNSGGDTGMITNGVYSNIPFIPWQRINRPVYR